VRLYGLGDQPVIREAFFRRLATAIDSEPQLLEKANAVHHFAKQADRPSQYFCSAMARELRAATAAEQPCEARPKKRR